MASNPSVITFDLATQCKLSGVVEPTAEYQFSTRKFRFDYAWVEKGVAVEVEGGVWMRGRHIRPQGFLRDMEKYNLAASLGWRVFRVTPQDVESGDALQWVKIALGLVDPRHYPQMEVSKNVPRKRAKGGARRSPQAKRPHAKSGAPATPKSPSKAPARRARKPKR